MSLSCAVNLLPDSCHYVWRRTRRRKVWTAVALLAALVVGGAWTALRAADQALLRLDRELARVQVEQAELDRQLMLAAKLRNDLANRGRALSALRHRQPLPEQLLTLSRLAPAGVVLTEIRAQPAGEVREPVQPSSSGNTRSPAGNRSPESRPRPLLVQFSGYAINHDELARLVAVLQQVPQWEQVELLRAARQPYGSGEALAFELKCRQPEPRAQAIGWNPETSR
jgi:hypothetical protein